MRTETGTALRPVRLADYRPPDYLIDRVELLFQLDDHATRVSARLHCRRNPARAQEGRAPLRFEGRKLTLISASINGQPVPQSALTLDAEGLTVATHVLPATPFVWECVTQIDPASNTALEGLYMSKDMFCTQCEAQGFRKITYFPDRPDVMSLYDVRIEADAKRFPVLLSNGNPVDHGPLPNGRHFVSWRDPHPKPCYLFALVAGNLVAHRDQFRTQSGRLVELAIFVRPGDQHKCGWAMDSLKRSMAWDERAYGREYDLDLFMIVAVDDFNMGAMENKGLNIFNAKYVLASPETATDRDFELIESIIAHEYFHNWTGNRITCRDWFQLCLKEGLTVFRDQQFTSDERSAAVKRIEDVRMLRARQFREDAGPLAHPVRPSEYVEINNFYTATVYEKGAEVIRMLHTLVGPAAYRKALDLYFTRHDGQACTVEQFLRCFEDITGRDLTAFSRWYTQAGTPRLKVTEDYDPKRRIYALTLRQSTPPTPGQPSKEPLVIPVAFGLMVEDGREIAMPDPNDPTGAAPTTRVLELRESVQSFRFEDMPGRPVLSLLRNFSAPVIVERQMDEETRAFLLAHDRDPFNRWEAGRSFAIDVLLQLVADMQEGVRPRSTASFERAMRAVLIDESLDPAYRALIFDLPGEDELAGEMATRGLVADPDAIHAARTHLTLTLAQTLADDLMRLYVQNQTPGRYDPNPADAGKRALKNRALAYLVRLKQPETLSLAARQFREANNMTDSLAAMTGMVHVGSSAGDAALETFYQRWKDDPLVVMKWLTVQATSPQEDTLDRIEMLTTHPAFEFRNPNSFRALIGAFAQSNPVLFHAADGSGYRLVLEWLGRLDPINPQTTARLLGSFETWRRYDTERQNMIRGGLSRLLERPDLSRDSREIISKILG